MPNTVVSIENVSKSYQLGTINTGTFYGDLKRWWARQRGKPDPYQKIGELDHGNRQDETLWALKDINFQVQQGEALGIIGRNGAGKSTLLKILSRVTVPTSGEIKVKGKIASLLEVGTGFHPELTGRENVYLNGAIMGMDKAEINRKFDEIVDFSGIEKFIDTPVKRYSSGMYVRLAFAVAAHLDPEILIVDEVLAVGDAEFQKKCLGKMGDVAHSGRTVLFVSHNLSALLNLCPRSILLVGGQKFHDGPSSEVVTEYIDLGRTVTGEIVWENITHSPGNEIVRLYSVRLLNNEQVTSDVQIDQPLEIEVKFRNMQPGSRLCTSIHLLDKMGNVVLASANMHSVNLLHDELFDIPLPVGLYRTVCVIPANFLNATTYSINVIILSELRDTPIYEREVLSFTAHDTGTMHNEYGGNWIGIVRPRLAWQTVLLRPLIGDEL